MEKIFYEVKYYFCVKPNENKKPNICIWNALFRLNQTYLYIKFLHIC